MTDSSVNEDVLVARSGTETDTNPGEILRRSSEGGESSLRNSATVIVNVENHPRRERALSSESESPSQINITINPADVPPSSENLSTRTSGGTVESTHVNSSNVNENPPATISITSEGQLRTENRRQSCPSASQQTAPPVAAASTSSVGAGSSTSAEMNSNSDFSTPRASTGGNSTTGTRRQRNGLFGINIDLNFEPSWLVPSNLAGRSLSVLPDWVRHPVNIIPNRNGDNSGAEGNARAGHSSSSSGSSNSRLLSHYHQSPSPSTANWSADSGAPHTSRHVPLRTRHTVTSLRSVDEDLDADYNPVSNLDIGAAGRERGDSNSYVIDMDTPMGAWIEESEVSSMSQARAGGSSGLGGSSSSHNNVGGSTSVGGETSDNANANNVGGSRRSGSESGLQDGGNDGGSGVGTPDGGASPSDAGGNAANERTRAAEILRDAPETRAFINEISRYTTIRPFIVICFLKVVFDHGTSILSFLALIVTFSHANSVVKKEVSKQKKRNLLYLSMIVINLAACVAFIYYIFNEMGLHYALAFLPISFEVNSFWSLVWVVGVTDYVAKFATVLVKIAVLSLPGCVVPFQKRGKYYLFIEHTSQIYRSFVPVHPWLYYLVSAYEGTSAVFGFFLAGLYIFFKMTDSVGRFKEWFKALEKLLSNVHYGANPTAKQLDSAGNICPICHDNYASPTRLACGHIFCEECVATWFDRERTCPMCRAKVVDDPTYRDGSTSQYIQLF